MRTWATAAALSCFCFAAVPGVASAANCPVGATATISGTLTHFPMPLMNNGAWVMYEPQNVTPCSVGALRGKVMAPAGCEPGRKFTATGYVTKALYLEIHVTSMRCF